MYTQSLEKVPTFTDSPSLCVVSNLSTLIAPSMHTTAGEDSPHFIVIQVKHNYTGVSLTQLLWGHECKGATVRQVDAPPTLACHSSHKPAQGCGLEQH